MSGSSQSVTGAPDVLDPQAAVEKVTDLLRESKSWGILLAVLGNTCIPVGLNLQKWVHNEFSSTNYIKVPYWWMGFSCMLLGEMGNFTAYSFAPAVLVAPLGGVSVIVNALIAWRYMGEEFRQQDLAGYALAIGGGVAIVWFAPNQTDQFDIEIFKGYLRSTTFVIYFLCLVVLSFGLIYLSVYTNLGRRYVHIDILVCSVIGSITVMATKGLATFIRLTIQGKEAALTDWLTWTLLFVVVFTAVTQLSFLNKAMVSFGTKEVVPVFYVFFTLCSLFGGIVLYREFDKLAGSNIAFFWFGVLMTFGGVFMLTHRKTSELDRDHDVRDSVESEPTKYEALLLGGMGGLGVGLLLFSLSLPLLACCGVAFGFGIGSMFYKDLENKKAASAEFSADSESGGGSTRSPKGSESDRLMGTS